MSEGNSDLEEQSPFSNQEQEIHESEAPELPFAAEEESDSNTFFVYRRCA